MNKETLSSTELVTKADVAKCMWDAYVWWMQQVSATSLEAAAGGCQEDCFKAIVRQLEHAKACHSEWINLI